MASFLVNIESTYVDVIGAYVARELQAIENEYQKRFEHRHKCGFNTVLDDVRLCEEEEAARKKITKRRNWLWYLMKTKQFATLDLELGTDFCLHYETDYNVERARRSLQSMKARRTKSDPVLFSRCNLPIDDDLDIIDICAIDEYLTEEADPVINRLHHHLVNRSKRVERQVEGFDVSPVDCKTSSHKVPLDDRNYDKLSMIAINLRYVIETLENARQVCISKLKSIRMFTSGKTLEEIEMDVLRQQDEELEYQGGGLQTPIDVDKYSKKYKLIKPSTNKPKCCDYCPMIVCMQCFKGEGCCMCKVKYQGNVEQDVGGDSTIVQQDAAHNVVLTETEITQSDACAVPNPGLWRSLS